MPKRQTNINVDTNLSGKEVRILVEKGVKLFGYLKLTPQAKQYLNDNPDLAEVIKKW